MFGLDIFKALFIRRNKKKASGFSPEAFLRLNSWCRWRDSNPHDPFGSTDFKSVASAIPPHRRAISLAIKPRLTVPQAQNGHVQLAKLENSYTTGNLSSTGFAAGFGTDSTRSDLIPLDFKLPACPP
jgi:hypothetical protein